VSATAAAAGAALQHRYLSSIFTELCAIESPSLSEGACGERVRRELEALGLDVHEDAAGEAIGADCGNMLARIECAPAGAAPEAERRSVLLCAHLDTVPLQAPVEPVLEDGFFENANEGILGADNKAAVAAMLAAVATIVSEGRPHAGIELVLTPMEEVGLRGAKGFDTSRLVAGHGYCYDHAAPIGHIVVAAPTQKSMRLVFLGRPAHSGIAPEDGRSAVQAAARAIADMRLGRVDSETTANVGLIEGGVAGNIIPPECRVSAEARSLDAEKARSLAQEMLDAAVHAANMYECELESRIVSEYEGYRFTRTHPAVRLAAGALERAGYEPTYIQSGGGADANVFNLAGVPCVNLCNGMAAIHTPDEHISVADLDGMTRVTLELVAGACN